MNSFSEKTLRALSPNVESKYYVYGLIDPERDIRPFSTSEREKEIVSSAMKLKAGKMEIARKRK